jgi:hypothetical protein
MRTMVEVWEGDANLSAAMRDDRIVVMGTRNLVRSMNDWFGYSAYARVQRPSRIAEG